MLFFWFTLCCVVYAAAWFHVCFLDHPALFLVLLPIGEEGGDTVSRHSTRDDWDGRTTTHVWYVFQLFTTVIRTCFISLSSHLLCDEYAGCTSFLSSFYHALRMQRIRIASMMYDLSWCPSVELIAFSQMDERVIFSNDATLGLSYVFGYFPPQYRIVLLSIVFSYLCIV